ncbi:MAG: carboxypeptidase-like regulatory domain-containing protein, partial [Planctomycetota bacterium]
MKLRLLGTLLGIAVLVVLWLGARRAAERGGEGADVPVPVRATEPATRLEAAPAAEREAVAAGRAEEADADPTRAAPRSEARLFGTFTAADDGRPLVGIELGLLGASGVETAHTDAGGSFAFELAPGAWTFFARPPPEHVPLVQELELAPGEERELSRALGAARGLCVRVWRSELGKLVPCVGAEVWLMQGESDGLARAQWPRVAALEPAHTDHAGRAELPFADFEKYVLAVERDGHVPYSTTFDFDPLLSWLPFSPDGCIHVVLEEAGALVHGRVLDPDGRPQAGALVAALDGDGLDGRFALSLAPPPDAGEVWLQPSEFPAFAMSAPDGSFALKLPRRLSERPDSVALIAVPGSEDLVHHVVQPLSGSELFGRSPVELRLPRAGEVELEFVD